MNKYIFVLLTMLITPEAFAIDMEYYAPNGLTEIGSAFKRLALIYSDGNYKMIFAVITVLALLMSGISVFLIKPLTAGLGSNPAVSWFAPFLIGVTIYLATFVSTGTIHLYDPIKNQTESISGVPDAIVAIAGLTNILERTMVDITNTASAYPYDKNAGGLNYKMLLDASNKGLSNKEIWLGEDVMSYYNECGELNMALPGATTDRAKLKTGVESIYEVLKEWQHPGVWVNMRNGNASIDNMTCTEAWKTVLEPQLQNISGNFNPMVDDVCRKNGFNLADINQQQACYDLVDQAWKLHGLTTSGAGQYVREAFLAQHILETVNREDPLTAQLTLAKRQLTLQGMGVMNVANDVLPNLKSVMTAIILGVMPFLTIFLVTPLYREALKFMVGGMLWLTTWGVMIAVTHAGAMDQAIAVFAEMRNNKMGLNAFMTADTAAMKALAVFGRMQAMSLMLSSAIAMAIYKFGGYAMTAMAEMQAGNLQNIGEQAAMQTMTPEGRGGLRAGLASGMSSDGYVGKELQGGGGTGSDWQVKSKALEDAGRYATVEATEDSATNNNQTFGQTAGDVAYTDQIQKIADTQALQQTQENLGNGDQIKGANERAASTEGGVEGGVQRAKNMVNLSGGDPTDPSDIRAMQIDMANNNNGFVMRGTDISENEEIASHLTDSQIEYLNENKDNEYIVNPSFNEEGGLTSASVRSNYSTSDDQNLNVSEVNSNINKTVSDTQDQTSTGNVATHTVGGNLNSILKAMEDKPTDGSQSQQEDWSVNRKAFSETYSNAFENQKGAEANYLANTLSGDLNNIVSGSKNNVDTMSVATKEGANLGLQVPSWFTNVTGVTGGASIGAGADQSQRWENHTSAQVNNAMVRSILDDSGGDIDKFSENYMSYKNALLESGQEARDESDLKN